jgi:PAS domain S-box-containing protein
MATHDRSTTGVTELIDRTSEGVLSVDEDWRVEVCNERARTILELSGEPVTGQSLWELRPDLVATPLYERCQRAMCEQIPETFETTPGAIDATLSVRCFPTDGSLSLYVRNVSLSRHRETELTRYATVVEAVSDGLVVFDDAGTIMLVNEALETLLDVRRGQIVGEPAASLAEQTLLDRSDVTSLVDAVESIEGGATEQHLDVELSSEQTDRSALELRLVPLPTGSAGTVACVFRDITARYERERVVTTLHDATRQLFRTADREEICATAVHTSADVLDLQTSGIWLLDEEHNRLDPIAATEGAREHFGGLPQFTDTDGLVWDVFRAGEPKLFHDLSGLAQRCPFDVSIRSELIVPIGDCGVLMAGDPAPEAFDDHDLDLAELLAAHTEVALERGQRERRSRSQTAALERRNRRLETIGDVVTGPIDDALATLEAAADGQDDTGAQLAALQGLLDDVAAIAGTSDEPTARDVCSVAEAAASAETALDQTVTLDVETDATVRADRDQFVRLLTALFETVTGGAPGTIAVATERSDSSRVEQVVVEATRQPPADDGTHDETTLQIEQAVAKRIACNHGWTVLCPPDESGSVGRLADVTTLSTDEQ